MPGVLTSLKNKSLHYKLLLIYTVNWHNQRRYSNGSSKDLLPFHNKRLYLGITRTLLW